MEVSMLKAVRWFSTFVLVAFIAIALIDIQIRFQIKRVAWNYLVLTKEILVGLWTYLLHFLGYATLLVALLFLYMLLFSVL